MPEDSLVDRNGPLEKRLCRRDTALGLIEPRQHDHAGRDAVALRAVLLFRCSQNLFRENQGAVDIRGSEKIDGAEVQDLAIPIVRLRA